MRIIYEKVKEGEEEVIIVRCNKITEDLTYAARTLSAVIGGLTAYKDGEIYKLPLCDIYYFEVTVISTLIICLIAAALCFAYLACTGWFLSLADVMLVISDVILLTLFGTVLSAIVNTFLSSQGQISAVGTIVSAGYGFICGAYMPLSQFGAGVRNTVMFLPGTYGTSLVRNHMLGGVFTEMTAQGFSAEAVSGIKDSVDCNLYFFKNGVSIGAMYAVVLISIAVLVGIYVAINLICSKNLRFSRVKRKA